MSKYPFSYQLTTEEVADLARQCDDALRTTNGDTGPITITARQLGLLLEAREATDRPQTILSANPNTAKLSLEKLFNDGGGTFRKIADEVIPSWPPGVCQVTIEEVTSGAVWCARYCVEDDESPDYARALEWKPAKKIIVEKWVPAE